MSWVGLWFAMLASDAVQLAYQGLMLHDDDDAALKLRQLKQQSPWGAALRSVVDTQQQPAAATSRPFVPHQCSEKQQSLRAQYPCIHACSYQHQDHTLPLCC